MPVSSMRLVVQAVSSSFFSFCFLLLHLLLLLLFLLLLQRMEFHCESLAKTLPTGRPLFSNVTFTLASDPQTSQGSVLVVRGPSGGGQWTTFPSPSPNDTVPPSSRSQDG